MGQYGSIAYKALNHQECGVSVLCFSAFYATCPYFVVLCMQWGGRTKKASAVAPGEQRPKACGTINNTII